MGDLSISSLPLTGGLRQIATFTDNRPRAFGGEFTPIDSHLSLSRGTQ
jgi:hypothetical protein